jgi:hypothetical protein
MEILKVINKGSRMDSYERFYMYKQSKTGICLNEQHVTTPNVLFGIDQSRKIDST